ncbi:sensor histidine kinase [Thiovibrio sp. JS02]
MIRRPGPRIRGRMNFSLKIFLIFLTVLLLFAVVSTLVFNQVQQRLLREHIYKEGRLLASVLAGNLQVGLYFEDEREIDKNMQAFFDLADVQAVLIYGSDGRVILRKVKRLPGSLPSDELFFSALARIRAGEIPTGAGDVHNGPDFLVFSADITHVARKDQSDAEEALYFDTETAPGEVIRLGRLQLVLNKKYFERGQREIIKQNGLFTILFVLLSLFASFLLTRDVTKPLKELIARIQERGGVEAPGRDELSLLEDTYQSLLVRLDQDFATIKDLKDGLEDKVVERTRELSRTLRQLQDAQGKLVHSEKMAALGQLVAGVAHEINNTTNFVSGALPPLNKRLTELEALLAQPATGEDAAERRAQAMKSIRLLLENVREGARRTNKIVNDLKNFSRPGDEALQPVDINQCLESTLTLAHPEYKYRITVARELAPDLPPVQGAQGQLNQVFMNILLNAVHAFADKGTILVRTWREGEKVHILFKDDGPGMPPYVLNKIFDPFFTTKAVGKGTGLGLSISYGIVKKHGGEILARSVLGQGAEFEVILPLRQEGAAAAGDSAGGEGGE